LNGLMFLKQNGYPITQHFNLKEPGNTFFRTADGRFVYITMVRSDQRNPILELLDCAYTDAALARAVAKWNAEELESACGKRKLSLTMVRTPEQWLAHPQGKWVAAHPLLTIEKLQASKPMPLTAAARPLSGIRVLEASQLLAGPNVGRTFAEQGADVLRISPPRQSDFLNFVMDTGIGKRSAYLDLGQDVGVRRFRELLMEADVFVQSFSPGSLERRGIVVNELVKDHPGLIFVDNSCFGSGGPWSDWIGYDPNAQTATGITAVQGTPDAPRRPPMTFLADYLTGFVGAAGAATALLRRAHEGGSYKVGISLAQTCTWVQSLGLVDRSLAPAVPEPAKVAVMDSPFGTLEYLAPLTHYARNKAYWEKPPVPLGASKAEWLPR
jgi:hypothetical protein